MNPEVTSVIQLFLRWAHLVTGVLWLGHLYFFNWVNAHFLKSLDDATRRAVVPQLMPRALYWFRRGAEWTWLTGLLLAGLLYYHSKAIFRLPADPSNNAWLWLAIFLIGIAVGFVIYNALMKAVKNVVVASTVGLLLFAGFYLLLEFGGKFSGRALYIHAGMILASTMAMNVMMVIVPYQKKIIAAVREGVAPDPVLVAQATLRSRHNTYMSVPMLFTMISGHYPGMYDGRWRDLCFLGVMVFGFAVVRWIYGHSAKVSA